MFIIHGTYRFSEKRVGYCNAFCLSCQQQSIAELYHFFKVGHLFFIPILPLGPCQRWKCRTCGNDPHERRTSKAGKILWAVLVLGMLIVSFTDREHYMHDQNGIIAAWLARIFLGGVFLALLHSIRTHTRQDIGLEEGLRSVAPLRDTCLYCHAMLDDSGCCALCRARRMPLY